MIKNGSILMIFFFFFLLLLFVFANFVPKISFVNCKIFHVFEFHSIVMLWVKLN